MFPAHCVLYCTFFFFYLPFQQYEQPLYGRSPVTCTHCLLNLLERSDFYWRDSLPRNIAHCFALRLWISLQRPEFFLYLLHSSQLSLFSLRKANMKDTLSHYSFAFQQCFNNTWLISGYVLEYISSGRITLNAVLRRLFSVKKEVPCAETLFFLNNKFNQIKITSLSYSLHYT